LIGTFLDESGNDSEEDNPNMGYTSLTDFVSEMRISEICGEIRGKFKLLKKKKNLILIK
jgi:hypothetical protein